MISAELRNVIEQLRSQPVIESPGVAEMRAGMEALGAMLSNGVSAEIEPVETPVRGEWITAGDARGDRTILYLHGGGYVLGSPRTHRGMLDRLAKATGARIFALDYRLAPEHPFPAAVEDAAAAWRWLLEEGADPGKAVIAGDSAGGGLTLATLVRIRDDGNPLPAAAVCISPWVDLEGTGGSMTSRAAVDPMVQKEGLLMLARAYLAGADPKTPLAAPLYADLAGLPPILVHVGDAETLLDDATRITERAKAAGVDVTLEVWPEMIHVWHIFAPMVPEGQKGIEAVAGWIGDRLD